MKILILALAIYTSNFMLPTSTDASHLIARSLILQDDDFRIITIKCDGMACTSCERTVEKRLLKLNGVKEVKANHKKKTVTIKFDNKKVTKDTLEKTINDSGYKVRDN